MAADPLHSLGGFAVDLPEVTIIDGNGNISTDYANIVQIDGVDANFTGNVTAVDFYGTFHGNISGNYVLTVPPTQVLFSEDLGGNSAIANGSANFTYDSGNSNLQVIGNIFTDSVTMGTGPNEFYTTRVAFATTFSSSPNQVLHSIPASEISSVDYLIIATDTVGVNRQRSSLFATVLNSDVYYDEYGTVILPDTGPGVCNFEVQYNAGNVQLTVTPIPSTLVDYRIIITRYKG